MEKFQKISSRIIIILALLWMLAVSMGQLSVGQSYMGIGALSAYIGIQNIILLNWGQRTGKMPPKIAYLIQRHGNNKADAICDCKHSFIFIDRPGCTIFGLAASISFPVQNMQQTNRIYIS